MTRRHVLTQMERLADRLQADASPYTVDEIRRLGELRSTFSLLESRGLRQPPVGDHQQRLARSGARLTERSRT